MAQPKIAVDEKWLTPTQVMERLQISKSKFYLEVAVGTLKYYKLGKMIRVRESDLEAWLQSKRV